AMVSVLAGVVAECACWEIRRTQATDLVTRAIERGEAAPQPRQILDHLIAPLYHHAVFGLPLDADYATQLSEDVMRMTEMSRGRREV
ncbi:MAG: TetR-like C-terminal domain-containing protein, partial [Gordonia sp. (in: high G+C Gram-positive bacteria)]